MILYVFWLVPAAFPGVVAQTSTYANCTDGLFKWVFNSNGQNPCRVAEILADQCDPQGFVILPLDSGAIYPGPTMDENNPCHCNTVLYSLISGCAACQDRSWITLTEYAQNCTTFVYETVYPAEIPSDTSVPHWAYLNVTATSDTFDVNAAFIASEPQLTTTASVTSTFVFVPTSTPVPQSLVNTGAIIGSVGSVAGVLALSIALLRWIFKRLQRSALDANNQLETGERRTMSPLPPLPSTSPPTSPTTVYPSDPEPLLTLYNCDDPITLPQEEPSVLQPSSCVDPQDRENYEPVMDANSMGSVAHGIFTRRRASF